MERYIDEYATALRRAGESVRILNEIRPGVYTDGWTFERHLPFLIRGYTEEIVHANTSRVGRVLALCGIPYVYTTHNPYWFESRNSLQRVLFEDERSSVRFARASIAFTDRLRDRMALVRPRRGPVVTIPLGVDTERFHARGPGDPSQALGVGEIAPRKRWEVAARAVQGTGVHLRLVGPIRDPAYAQALGGLGAEVVGEVSDEGLLAAYETAGLLLHPSEKEALPGVVLQAMAFGRPVIGGHAISPVRGVLASPVGDEAESIRFMREWVVRLSRDEGQRKEWGQRVRGEVELSYSWPRIVQQHLALYRGVLAGSPS